MSGFWVWLYVNTSLEERLYFYAEIRLFFGQCVEIIISKNCIVKNVIKLVIYIIMFLFLVPSLWKDSLSLENIANDFLESNVTGEVMNLDDFLKELQVIDIEEG